jgi:hypothetical protein
MNENNTFSIKILLIDELGQVTRHQMSILNKIFGLLHNTIEFFGGIHIIATIDNYQLLSDESSMIYRWDPLLFYFKPFVLQYYIRATCPFQQDILTSLRKYPKSAVEIDRITELIMSNCSFQVHMI